MYSKFGNSAILDVFVLLFGSKKAYKAQEITQTIT